MLQTCFRSARACGTGLEAGPGGGNDASQAVEKDQKIGKTFKYLRLFQHIFGTHP